VSNPFMAEIRIISFNFAPKGWAFCNGQLMQINQNQALFSLLGTTYGGNGQTTFGLPNLQGRTPFHVGQGFTLGQRAGEEAHTLTINELATHIHTLGASTSNTGQVAVPNATTPAVSTQNPYESTLGNTGGAMAPAVISNTGGSQPHNNMSPYLCLYFIIALQGFFPTPN
jgi:microcystin-dependent protein